jgi:hypothetical protein
VALRLRVSQTEIPLKRHCGFGAEKPFQRQVGNRADGACEYEYSVDFWCPFEIGPVHESDGGACAHVHLGRPQPDGRQRPDGAHVLRLGSGEGHKFMVPNWGWWQER